MSRPRRPPSGFAGPPSAGRPDPAGRSAAATPAVNAEARAVAAAASEAGPPEPVAPAATDQQDQPLPEPLQLGLSFPDTSDPQQPADVAIVIPTVLRPVIARAITSIYRQDFQGRIQILIGVDKPMGPLEPLLQVLAQRPAHVAALVLQLPWSTSARHGGVHTATDTGSLRSILSFMANSRAVAYLDDDNSLLPDHLRLLHGALQGKAWAWSQRLLVDERDERDLVVDRWDSVGPDRGRMASQGGFVDTNCLMLDKVLCAPILGRWSESGLGRPGLTADRHLFASLRRAPYGRVAKATVRYYIRPTNILHRFLATGQEF